MGNNKQQKRSTMNAAGRCPELYSNNLFLHGSASDVRMLFLQAVSREGCMGPCEIELEQRAAVTVSWINAKKYRDALSRAIELHEAKNGEIRTDLTDLIVTTSPAPRPS
jgi:hypothetical protein